MVHCTDHPHRVVCFYIDGAQSQVIAPVGDDEMEV